MHITVLDCCTAGPITATRRGTVVTTRCRSAETACLLFCRSLFSAAINDGKVRARSCASSLNTHSQKKRLQALAGLCVCVAALWELPPAGASASWGLRLVCGSASCAARLRVWLGFVCGSASFVALLRLCFVCASFVLLRGVLQLRLCFRFVCGSAACWLCCVVVLLCGGFCSLAAVLRGFCCASWLLPCFVASALLRSFCSALWLLLSLWGLLLCFVLALTCSRSSFHFAGVNIAHTSQRGATSVDWLPGLVFVNTTNDESSVPWTWPVKFVVSTEEASLKYSG